MKMTLAKFAKKHRLTRYEVLRMISQGRLEYEIVYKDGKKSYIIEEESYLKERPKKEVYRCGGVEFELVGDRLIMRKENKEEVFKRV